MHSQMVTSYRFFGGPIALRGLVRFLDTTGPSLTKGVYAYFDRISYEVVSLCPRVTYLQYLQSCLQKVGLTMAYCRYLHQTT